MFYYVPRYDEQTAIKRGEYPTPADLTARQSLFRENKIECCAETWVKDYGFVPVYESPKQFNQNELDLLCLQFYDLKKKN